MLSDGMWETIERALIRSKAHITKTTRETLEAILWRTRTGSPWRDLPTEFGPWKTVYNRFNRWSKAGRIAAVFELLQVDVDGEWQCMDATIVKAHRHARADQPAG